MAKAPLPIETLTEKYGPTLKYTPPGGWADSGSRSGEKLVKTHCCFCGQQCGIQLRVHQNQVVGFEPWEEFPFNRGMLCPKGVKRYLQGSHPDRLLDPLMRTADGFRTATWDEALAATASRLSDVQARFGKDAVAVLGGASLISEKTYLLGKLARVALGTEVPPFYTDDDALASALANSAASENDPLWRMPLWRPYDQLLESKVADVNNVSSSNFGGSITAALFLRRFVDAAKAWLHCDIFAWNQTAKPGRPEGGECQAARLVYALVKQLHPPG